MERSFELTGYRIYRHAIIEAETASKAKYKYYLMVNPNMHFFDFVREIQVRVTHDKRRMKNGTN